MLFRIFTDHLRGETIWNTCERMTNKFGTDDYIDMIHAGFDIPFSKYRREFCKEFTKEMISRVKHKK